MGTVRGLITLALLVAFVGLVVRVYARGRKAEFDSAARLPFEESPEHDRHVSGTRDEHR